MKKDDNYLHEMLNRPRVPQDLEEKIVANWKTQTDNQHQRVKFRYLVAAAGLIGIVLTTYMFKFMLLSNDLIAVAVNDIRKDDNQHVGISVAVDLVLQQEKIHLPPSSMSIEMTKACNLNGNKTMHVKVAGEKQGSVHLFIKKGDFEATLLSSNDEPSAMPWRLIKPRNDISVLVIYTRDMNPVSVDNLIQTMFYT